MPAAAAVLAARAVGSDPRQLEVYREVALEVLGATKAARDAQAEQDVRTVMQRALQQLELSASAARKRVSGAAVPEAGRCLLSAHRLETHTPAHVYTPESHHLTGRRRRGPPAARGAPHRRRGAGPGRRPGRAGGAAADVRAALRRHHPR